MNLAGKESFLENGFKIKHYRANGESRCMNSSAIHQVGLYK